MDRWNITYYNYIVLPLDSLDTNIRNKYESKCPFSEIEHNFSQFDATVQ